MCRKKKSKYNIIQLLGQKQQFLLYSVAKAFTVLFLLWLFIDHLTLPFGRTTIRMIILPFWITINYLVYKKWIFKIPICPRCSGTGEKS